MSTWRLNGKDIDYGPLQVDYIIINGVVRPKYTHTKIEMSRGLPNQNAYKPDFPIYTMLWPRASNRQLAGGDGAEPLGKTLKELPLNSGIVMKDGHYNISDLNIEVINRKIDYVRTNPNNEVIEQVTLTIRFL